VNALSEGQVQYLLRAQRNGKAYAVGRGGTSVLNGLVKRGLMTKEHDVLAGSFGRYYGRLTEEGVRVAASLSSTQG
jgi:hypothetical protein